MPLDVEQLLQRLESSGFEKEASTLHVLFSSAAAAARSRPASPQDEQLPARLGPFEVIGELGGQAEGLLLAATAQHDRQIIADAGLVHRVLDLVPQAVERGTLTAQHGYHALYRSASRSTASAWSSRTRI